MHSKEMREAFWILGGNVGRHNLGYRSFGWVYAMAMSEGREFRYRTTIPLRLVSGRDVSGASTDNDHLGAVIRTE